MAATQPLKAAGSKWGFLSQAVNSLESGLDKMLAEDDEKPKKLLPKQVQNQIESSSSTPRTSTELKRNDRLQARLAQAMARKETIIVPSDVEIPVAKSMASTPTAESEDFLTADAPGMTHEQSSTIEGIESDIQPVGALPDARRTKSEGLERSDMEGRRLSSSSSLSAVSAVKTSTVRLSQDLLSPSFQGSLRQSTSPPESDVDASVLNLQLNHEKSLKKWQDEASAYLERIDALQRNLQILTKQAIDDAKNARAKEDISGHDRQLAEKDEKIALLIEEGTKLGKNELTLRTAIKKLRSEHVTTSKDHQASRKRALKAEDDLSMMRSKIADVESASKTKDGQIAALSTSAVDAEAIRQERNALKTTLSDIRNELAEARRAAEDARKQAQNSQTEASRRGAEQRQKDLESAKVERDISEGELSKRINELQALLAQEKTQTQSMESEMLAEQATLESKLQSFRVRAEEAASGDTGDSQAKLLRQIETLQYQYAAASSNWQGIESTMLARITSIEKERDEITSREARLGRKLKDVIKKQKGTARELEEMQERLSTVQNEDLATQAEQQKLVQKNEQLEADLMSLRNELESQRTKLEKDMHKRLEEEKARWHASLQPAMKLDSPVVPVRRGINSAFNDSFTNPLSPYPTHSRRSSIHPHHDFVRHNSMASIRPNGTLANSFPIPETPSILEPDQDDFFTSISPTPASAQRDGSGGRHSHAVHDMISVSTAAAGPSVQLVERLSANVRKLESEKAVSKDELTRLQAQRDEARQQVVDFMRDLESRKNNDEKLTKVAKAHVELEQKHTATLELLGEKTEQVEELRGDVEDVKEMYRELADQMGRTAHT
ncbi:hypothetical protein LTR66_015595 [Elasticomyces elasticus]|nr:hypothetical protein LTR66_015595 [Elasticomyces elasticus]